MSVPPFLGGVDVNKWFPFLDLGAQSLILGHFWRKCSLLGTQRWDFEWPNGGIDICFERLSLLSKIVDFKI